MAYVIIRPKIIASREKMDKIEKFYPSKTTYVYENSISITEKKITEFFNAF